MVDVRATNDKLRARAHRIVTTITGAPPQDVERALDEHGGRAKPAALALLTGLAPAQVDAALTQHHGDLRATLTALTKES